MNVRELRVGNIVEAYGTNGNPNEWIEIVVTPEHIKTCESHPEWFREVLSVDKTLFKIPKKFKAFASVINVGFDNTRLSNEGILGDCSFTDNQINICSES